MEEKLKSRKLWVAVGMAALATLLSGLGVEDKLVEQLIDLAQVYILGEAGVDVMRLLKPKASLKSGALMLLLALLCACLLTSCFTTFNVTASGCYTEPKTGAQFCIGATPQGVQASGK